MAWIISKDKSSNRTQESRRKQSCLSLALSLLCKTSNTNKKAYWLARMSFFEKLKLIQASLLLEMMAILQ